MINSLPTNFDYLNRYVDALMKSMHKPRVAKLILWTTQHHYDVTGDTAVHKPVLTEVTGPYHANCRECHRGNAFYSTSEAQALIDMKLEGWKELEEVFTGSGYTTYEGVCPECLEGMR